MKLFLLYSNLILIIILPYIYVNLNTPIPLSMESNPPVAGFEILNIEESPLKRSPQGYIHPLLNSHGKVTAYYLDSKLGKAKFSFFNGDSVELDNVYKKWVISEHGDRIINYGEINNAHRKLGFVIYTKEGEMVRTTNTDFANPLCIKRFTTFAMNHDGSFWLVGALANQNTGKNDFLLVHYDSNGVEKWRKIFPKDVKGNKLKVSPDGQILMLLNNTNKEKNTKIFFIKGKSGKILKKTILPNYTNLLFADNDRVLRYNTSWELFKIKKGSLKSLLLQEEDGWTGGSSLHAGVSVKEDLLIMLLFKGEAQKLIGINTKTGKIIAEQVFDKELVRADSSLIIDVISKNEIILLASQKRILLKLKKS